MADPERNRAEEPGEKRDAQQIYQANLVAELLKTFDHVDAPKS